jgi:hypothetical protein
MNPNIKSAAGGNRSFGLHGAGKGDADRTSDVTAYNERLMEIEFPRVHPSLDEAFTKSRRGYKKVYGVTKEQHASALAATFPLVVGPAPLSSAASELAVEMRALRDEVV